MIFVVRGRRVIISHQKSLYR